MDNTLKEILDPASKNGYAIAGLVVLGWEDAIAYVEASSLGPLTLKPVEILSWV